uniref:Uncharacterized protein n=1 Tax=Amphimedon queenslandica TaxID=400682 RepID=A0A1X7T094_AMPQE
MSGAKDTETEILKREIREQDAQVSTEQIIDPLSSMKKAELLLSADVLQSITGIYGNLTVLPVDSNGLFYHCDKYGTTLIIPEGAVQESATVWFGACLYGDNFDFDHYVPVTPI